jgi:copper resistance protein B
MTKDILLVRVFALVALLALVTTFAAESHGATFGSQPGWPPPVMDNMRVTYGLIDLLEYRSGNAPDAVVWDTAAWTGGDYNKLWMKFEGEQETRDRKSGTFEAQALYARLIAPFWNLQTGVRFDQRYRGGNADPRGFFVIGAEGLAPYRFDLEPSLFVSNKGKVSANLTATYDLYITQRLALQPRLETNVALQEDRALNLGTGFNNMEISLRLRYDIRRELSPYVGVTWYRALGSSTGLRRAAHEGVDQVSAVIGIRAWF